MNRSGTRARPQPRPVSAGPGIYSPVSIGYPNDSLEEFDIGAANAPREYHGYYEPDPTYDYQRQSYFDGRGHSTEQPQRPFETHEQLPAELPPQEHTPFIIEHEPEFEQGTGSYNSAFNGGFRQPPLEQPEPKLSISAQDGPNYRPPVLRWPFLVGLTLVVILLMILTELSVHLLPVDNSTPNLLRRHTVTPIFYSYSSFRPLGDQTITLAESSSTVSTTSVGTNDPTVASDRARTAKDFVTSEAGRTWQAAITSDIASAATAQYAENGGQSVTTTLPPTLPPPATTSQFVSNGDQSVTLDNTRTGTCTVTATSIVIITTTVPVITVTYGQTPQSPPSSPSDTFPDEGCLETNTVTVVTTGYLSLGLQTVTVGAPDSTSPSVMTTTSPSPSPTQTPDRPKDDPSPSSSPSPSPSHQSPQHITPTRSATPAHTTDAADRPSRSAQTSQGGLVTLVSGSHTVVASIPDPKDQSQHTAIHSIATATKSKQKPVNEPTETDTSQSTAREPPDESVTVVTLSTRSDGQVATRPFTTLTTIFETHHHQSTVSASQEDSVSGTSNTPAYLVAYLTTLKNAKGKATATYTVIPDPAAVLNTLTLANSAGIPMSTMTADVLELHLITISSGPPFSSTHTSAPSSTELSSTSTHTFSSSSPHPTSTDTSSTTAGNRNSTSSGSTILVYYISEQEYFTATFLPTLLATLLSIPIRVLDLTAKKFAPFRSLAQPEGAAAADSLWLPTGGITGILVGLHSPLVLLTSLLVLLSSVLIPLSASAVGFAYHGGCHEGGMSIVNCARTLAVFPTGARVALALLAVMALLTVAVLAITVRWRSGVAANPWSIAGMASLGTHEDVAALVRGRPPLNRRKVRERGVVVALQPFEKPGRADEWGYGIVVLSRSAERLRRKGRRVSFADERTSGWDSGGAADATGKRRHLPFLMLHYWSRVGFLVFLCGVLAVVLYYNNTGGDTSFEHFMDSEGFGVKFLFTAIGVVITLFWFSFFACVAIMSPYKIMANNPQPASRSVLLSPPTNPFSGLVTAVRRRHIFLILIALLAILSEFLPLLLSQIPWRVSQTLETHMVCTWMSVGILCLMVLVVGGSLFIAWPHMPVDPSTVAGSLFYVADSGLVDRLEGLSLHNGRQRDDAVSGMKLRYEFAEGRDGQMKVRALDNGGPHF